MTANADLVGHPHAVFAATWNAPDPWPICLDCGERVYLADEWHHFDRSLDLPVTDKHRDEGEP
jgi:hypothetical protein